MPPVKPVIQICVTESLSRLWGKSAIWSIMTIMRQRWTHQFHSPKYYALLMDNSRSPLFRDSVFLPPSFHPLLTSPPLHKCFRHPLSLTPSSKTLCEREIKKIQESQRTIVTEETDGCISSQYGSKAGRMIVCFICVAYLLAPYSLCITIKVFSKGKKKCVHK